MSNLDTSYEFELTAARYENGLLHAFYVSPITACVYGIKDEQIETVKLKVAENQSREDEVDFEYWGWFDFKEQKFSSFIQDSYLKLWICFPAGIETAEERGTGKAYRLEEVKN